MTDESRERPIKSRPTRTYVILGVLAVSLGVFGYLFFHDANEIISDAHARRWAAAMVIKHMEWNGGSWPQEWEELRPPYEIFAGESGAPLSFDQLRSRVAIDFAADPGELSEVPQVTGKRPFRVIYLRNGEDHYWTRDETNSMILQYLHERARRDASYKYPKAPDPAERRSRQALVRIGAKFEIDEGGHVMSVNLNSISLPNWGDVITHLKQLQNLRQLQLGYANITDDGLQGIKDFANLEKLSLYGTRVTDAGLRHLRGMGKLRGLDLSDDKCTDAGLNDIKHLQGLSILNLNGTTVTDAGLTQLYELQNLQHVSLRGTRVTGDGLRQLREALPNCDVRRD